MKYVYVDSPIGRLLLAGDSEALRVLSFAGSDRAVLPDRAWEPDPGTLARARAELSAYFSGQLKHFTVSVQPDGTPFQQRVWSELRRIPYGETISYAELARRIGNVKAVRAVGLANGANPIAIIVPCHRVIGSNGTLVGYGGGLPIKQALLALEQRQQRLL
jgi:methylated-DNA-[protein]-cysteine S-methyltransferase